MGYMACADVTGKNCEWFTYGDAGWMPLADGKFTLCTTFFDNKEDSVAALNRVLNGISEEYDSNERCREFSSIGETKVEEISRWGYFLHMFLGD